jgi:hypothetical protein
MDRIIEPVSNRSPEAIVNDLGADVFITMEDDGR